jgi:hypothetical protein
MIIQISTKITLIVVPPLDLVAISDDDRPGEAVSVFGKLGDCVIMILVLVSDLTLVVRASVVDEVRPTRPRQYW